MDFDVLHYYEKFINNRFTFLNKDMEQSKVSLNSIFSELDSCNFFRALLKCDEIKYSDFKNDIFFSFWTHPILKNDLFYSLSALNKDGANNSWLLSSLGKKFSNDTTHSFYLESALNFINLKNTLVDSFFLNNILINFEEPFVLTLSDAFLKDLADKFEDVLTLDCQIVPEYDLPEGYPRLLTTDQVLVIPSETPLRFLVTSNDVIHS